MIQVTCPGCKSRLNAKDKLAGQTRKCPKCGRSVRIVADGLPTDTPQTEASAEETAPILAPSSGETSMLELDSSERLNRTSHYLICGKTKMVARWERNGRGWMLFTKGGAVSAARNQDQIPHQGDFQLVELHFRSDDQGTRMDGLHCYRLASRWALNSMVESEDAILAKITGPGALDRTQKELVRQAIKDRFMRPIWGAATDVLEFLGNTDYHSSGTPT